MSFDKIIDNKDFKKNFAAIVIPENHYFLLGDNRSDSEDSRYWKNPTIPKVDILGKLDKIIPKEK